MTVSRASRLTVLALPGRNRAGYFFHATENSSRGVAGNGNLIVHTDRAYVMRQAASLKNFELGLLLPGIVINTGPADYFPIEQMQMSRFNGEHGELFGSAITGEIGTQ